MRYSLVLKSGKVMTFYVRSVAEMFQHINGGVLYEGSYPPVPALIK
jgi:hypothetical protein